MKKTVNTRRGHLNKLFTLILTMALMGFFIIPVGVIYATDSDNGAEPDGGGVPVEAASEDAEPPAVIVIDPPKRTQIEDTQIPQAAPEPEEDVTVIPPERPPLAVFATWALLNLLFTIATGVITIALLVTYFKKRKEENGETAKKHLALRLIAIAATAVSIILFIITQDMALSMFLADQWTIWHVVITAATVVLAVLSMKKFEVVKEIG